MIRAGKSRPAPRAAKQHEESAQRARPARGADSRVIRIIGGSLRGRRFRFADVPGVRPTPDRVRETVFNWLSPRIHGARCLDLFTGSGALGLEALSRGAASVTMVDESSAVVRALTALIAEWHMQGARIERADAVAFLGGPPEPFDVVFLDPPFASGLLTRCATLLEERGWLAPGARIYVESAVREALPPLPPAWELLKAKRAGEVGYHLFAETPRGAAPE